MKYFKGRKINKIQMLLSLALQLDRSHAGEIVRMPGILSSLQRSVFSLLIRRTVHPDYMSHGVPVSCLLDTFPVNWREV